MKASLAFRNYTTLSDRSTLVRKQVLWQKHRWKKIEKTNFVLKAKLKKNNTLLLHILVTPYRNLHKIVNISCHWVDYIHQRNYSQSVYWPGLSQFSSSVCEWLNTTENSSYSHFPWSTLHLLYNLLTDFQQVFF